MKVKALAIAGAMALTILGATAPADAARRAKTSDGWNWASWEQPQQRAQVSKKRRSAQRAYRGRSYASRSDRSARYASRSSRSARYASRASSRSSRGAGYGYRVAHQGVGGRPRAWCGWWMRTQRGGGPEYNLAWNWRNYGSASGPQVGAVVVWRHHVGEIVGQASNGQWIVRSGNDGGRVRERARSVSGAIFRI